MAVLTESGSLSNVVGGLIALTYALVMVIKTSSMVCPGQSWNWVSGRSPFVSVEYDRRHSTVASGNTSSVE